MNANGSQLNLARLNALVAAEKHEVRLKALHVHRLNCFVKKGSCYGGPMPETETDSSIADLAARLRAAVIPLSRVLRVSAGVLTPTELSVLGATYRHGPLAMRDLAERERLSPPMISRVVSALEERDFLERVPSKEDRRVCRVRVSDAGRVWISRYLGVSNAWLADRLSGLADDQRAVLTAAVPLLEMLIDDDHG